MIDFDKILKEKIEYYGETKAAVEFAVDKFCSLAIIEEYNKLLDSIDKFRNKQAVDIINQRIKNIQECIK